MATISLPVLTLPLPAQRYSCHGCGNCCRDFTVQLRGADLRKLAEQNWEMKMGGPVTIEFRGVQYLRQREDGACVFLMDDGLCRIHKEFGFSAKPIACQLFPFHITPGTGGLVSGLNFACQSVLENKGGELRTHARELGRMAGDLEELKVTLAPPPLLAPRLRGSKAEERLLIDHINEWIKRDEVGLSVRLDGLAWIAQSLAKATLEKVRDDRFADLLDVLFGALPDELEHHPLGPATRRQSKLLRQAVFARTEDPKLATIARHGRLRVILGQLGRNRRFKSGSGPAPVIGQGWKSVDLKLVSGIAPACGEPHEPAIDDLMTRWLRATVLGGRAWGSGYYGWSMIEGLQSLLLNAACVGWLARLHASGHERSSLQIEDARAALGRIDRTAGRAKWLGSSAERLRLAYLNADDGLRRVLADTLMTRGGD